MRQMVMLFMLPMLAAGLIMCAAEKKEDVEEKTIEAKVKTGEMAECPGCGMRMEKSKMVVYEVDGEKQYYCSEECKAYHLSQQKKTSDSVSVKKDN